MSDDAFESEFGYQVSLAIAEGLFRSEILTSAEFDRVRTLLLETYHPPIGTLLAEVG